MKAIRDSLIVFAFFGVVTVHLQTDFLGQMTKVRPRAVRGLDGFLDVVFVSWLGHGATVALFAVLTLVLPVLVFMKNKQREANEAREAAPARTEQPSGGRPAATFGRRGTGN